MGTPLTHHKAGWEVYPLTSENGWAFLSLFSSGLAPRDEKQTKAGRIIGIIINAARISDTAGLVIAAAWVAVVVTLRGPPEQLVMMSFSQSPGREGAFLPTRLRG